jgi:hypothetical protein
MSLRENLREKRRLIARLRAWSRKNVFQRPRRLPTTAAAELRAYVAPHFDRFGKAPYLLGWCNICGRDTAFFCPNQALYRESLVCAECLTTSRYRSIARGILRAVRELTGVEVESLAQLSQTTSPLQLKIYDTQPPFYYLTAAYPIPDILNACAWIEVQTSQYQPERPWGTPLGQRHTNQNLEQLTFPDASFDIVITTDVMEHVRLADRAHREISRVVKPGGVYLFTVPHFRGQRETLVRVATPDPADPTQDQLLMEPEYHGDAHSEAGRVLTYRAYGTDLDEELASLGFTVEYSKENLPELGIMNTELFFCRLGSRRD